jgi:tocopherol cyclase
VGEPIIDDESTSAALEVGGGPWWGDWGVTAEPNPAVSFAVNLPIEDVVGTLQNALPFELPSALSPPGY